MADYVKTIAARVLIRGAVAEALKLWWDEECTVPLGDSLDFGEVSAGGSSTIQPIFYVQNVSPYAFRCLAQDVWPKGPTIFIGATFTPFGNNDNNLDSGEVGVMKLWVRVMPGAPEGVVEFTIEIKPVEV